MDKKKFMKIALIIVLALVVVLLIYIIRNMIIINNIITFQETISSNNNYSFEIAKNDSNSKMEQYYKDGISMMILKENDKTKSIVWLDKSIPEYIEMNPSELTASISKLDVIVGNELPLTNVYTKELTFTEKLKMALTSFIGSEKINGESCYVVHSEGSIYYIQKDSGLVLKITNGPDSTTEYSNWKFNEITDKDISRPNLVGYTTTEQ